MATTLPVLVLRGRRYVCAHLGDSRLYLLRAGVCTRLTSDHVWEHPELRNVLSRAVGLDRHFQLDFFDGELQPGDCFLLCSDGVWAAREHARLRVHELPAQNLRDALAGTARLPLPPRFKPGQEFDGLRIDELLHDSRATLLYRVTDQLSGQALALKTLRPDHGGVARPADRLAFFSRNWYRLSNGAVSTTCRPGTKARRCSACSTPACISRLPTRCSTASG